METVEASRTVKRKPVEEVVKDALDQGLVDIAGVTGLTMCGKSYIYDEIKAGRFPAPIKLRPGNGGKGGNTGKNVWTRRSVQEWVADRIRASLRAEHRSAA